MSAKTNNPRLRRWALTIWEPEDKLDLIEEWFEAQDNVRYIAVGAIENCPDTGRAHAHACVHFTNAVYKSFFYRGDILLPDENGKFCSYLEPISKDADYERYMTKEGGYILVLGTSGDVKIPEDSSLFERIKSLYIRGGVKLLAEELSPHHYSHALRILPGLQATRRERLAAIGKWVKENDDDVSVFFSGPRGPRMFNAQFYGSSGTGKSLMARRLSEYLTEQLKPIMFGDLFDLDSISVFSKSANNTWYDGFDQHAVLLLDDWRPGSHGMKLSSVLTLFDRYDSQVEVKGGTIQMNNVSVFVTSIYPLWHEEWVPVLKGESITQLIRRMPFFVNLDCLRGNYWKKPVSGCKTCKSGIKRTGRDDYICGKCRESQWSLCGADGLQVYHLCCGKGRMCEVVRSVYEEVYEEVTACPLDVIIQGAYAAP